MRLCVEIAILLALASIGVSLGTPWVAENYPNPKTNPENCLPSKRDGDSLWLCDPDSVLTTEEAAELLQTVKDINSGAECICNCATTPENGYVVGVAVAEAIAGQPGIGDQSASLEEFGETVKESWFGSNACDDRALILLSRNDSQIILTLGEKLSEVVPLESLDNIDAENEPLLEESKYKEALATSLQELALVINQIVAANGTETMTTMPETTEPPVPEDNLVWGILGVLAIMSILIFHYWIKY